MTTECKHENGWITKEEFCLFNDVLKNNDNIIECECNNLDCNERRRFKFDLCCIEEVTEDDM